VTAFDAVYYDGKTSARQQVHVWGEGEALVIAGGELRLKVRLADVSVDAPLAGVARALTLPGGAQLQTHDQAAVEALFPRAHLLETWVHGLERRWPEALAALALIAVFAWWVVVDGLPRAAKLAAELVPPRIEAQLGEQTLATIDRSFCAPTKLPAARQAALRERFGALTAGLDDGYAYRLELRSCKIGANAFALPGGAVIMTDALVKLAQNDDQLSAVLAHEIGHVRHRHGLRLGLQAAGIAALSAALFGDAVSITGLAVTLPTAILQNGYSRELETEADDYAFERLKEVGISPKAFAEMMERFEKIENEKRPKGSAMDYLSTHPATAARIQRALEAAEKAR
jgi:Zn-dependent protease with chaperone function